VIVLGLGFGFLVHKIISLAAVGFTVFLSRIQWAIRGQIKFPSHARGGRVGERVFAVSRMLDLAAHGRTFHHRCRFRAQPALLLCNVAGWPRMATPSRRKGNY
jgi:hypothetical protein